MHPITLLKVDTLSPYLPLLRGGTDASSVRERCLQDLRDRLALRANLLQDRLDEVVKVLGMFGYNIRA